MLETNSTGRTLGRAIALPVPPQTPVVAGPRRDAFQCGIELHEVPRLEPAAFDDEQQPPVLDDVRVLPGVDPQRDAIGVHGDDFCLRHQRTRPIELEAGDLDVVRAPDGNRQYPIAEQEARPTPRDLYMLESLEIDGDVPGIGDIGIRQIQLALSVVRLPEVV